MIKYENKAALLKPRARSSEIKRGPGLEEGYLAAVMWPIRELMSDGTAHAFLRELEQMAATEDWKSVGRTVASGDVVVIGLRAYTVYENSGVLKLEQIKLRKREVSEALCKILTGKA